MATHKQIVLAQYPQGVPSPSDFRLESVETPSPADGEVLVRNFLVSVDPGMRNRLTDAHTYAPPIPIGGVVEGASLGEVTASNNPKFNHGDVVAAALGWTEYGLSNGRGLMKLEPSSMPWSAAIGVLGIPGLTAYFGLFRVGAMQPGETVLVSSAAGPVGATALQIAKLQGCRTAGIAGEPAKCNWIRELGADAAIDYKNTPDLSTAIGEACPDGVDIYFDNVGNDFIDAAIPHMKPRGRIVISGQVAEYNVPPEDRRGIRHTLEFITKRLRMEGFVVFDDARAFGEARTAITQWIDEGKLTFREEFFDASNRCPPRSSGSFTGTISGGDWCGLDPNPPGGNHTCISTAIHA
jgi:hypothetical protein